MKSATTDPPSPACLLALRLMVESDDESLTPADRDVYDQALLTSGRTCVDCDTRYPAGTGWEQNDDYCCESCQRSHDDSLRQREAEFGSDR
jgi:hypothetical protein